jgi:hypothetical protein
MDRLQQQRKIDLHLHASLSVCGAERDRTSARETFKSALEDLVQEYIDWQLSRVTTDLLPGEGH